YIGIPFAPCKALGRCRGNGVDVASNERFRPVYRKSKSLLDPYGQHIAFEIVDVLARKQNLYAHTIEDLSAKIERAGKELAGGHGLRLHNRQTPQRRTNRRLSVADDVAALAVLGQFDASPIGRIQHEAGSRVFGEHDLKNRKAQAINRRLVGRVESRSKRGSLRHNAVQVLAGAVAVEKLILFDILQTISTARIDVGGERRSVVHDLARSLEDVRNRANRRGKQVKCDVRLRLRVAFRNRTGVVGEAGLLDELDARLRRGAGSKQVADGKLTIRRSD